MAKILISSLGKGRENENGTYDTTEYSIDGKVYENSSISKVLTEHFEIDKLFLLGTSGSSWDMISDKFDGDDETSLKLMEKLENSNVSQKDLDLFGKIIDRHLDTNGSKAWIIEYGIDEEELWNNFGIFLEISRLIENGDEVYLDITHAFRSLPMMAFVMTEFASQINDIDFKLSGIYYGMYEYRNDPKNRNKTTPIVDISIIYELHRWIRAIDAMKNYGNLDPLVKLLDIYNSNEEDVTKVFTQLNNTIKMANIASIKQFVTSASKKINALKNSDNKIIRLISKDVIDFVDRLNKDKMSDFQYELAKWFYDNKQYALSYMALTEAINTKACEIKGYDIASKEGREAGKEFMNQVKQGDDFLAFKKGSVSNIRNNIAHQLDERKGMVNQDIQKLDYFFEIFDEFMRR